MEIQAVVSEAVNASLVGKRLSVLIDRREGDYYIGRTEHDSPEVDPEVLISSDKVLKIGEFYNVEIVSADNYDLYGRI